MRWVTAWLCSGFLLAAVVVPAAGGEPSLDEEVSRFLSGDEESKAKLLKGGLAAIQAIEKVLLAPASPDQEHLSALLRELGDDDYRVRERATSELSRANPELLPRLKQCLAEAKDPEVKVRLEKVIEGINGVSGRVSALEKMLSGLYAGHAEQIFAERWPELLKNPVGPKAGIFFRNAPLDSVWPQVKKGTKDQQLRYLLFLVHAGRGSAEATKLLSKYSGQVVLRAAAETYWPVEIEPLERDGAYHWAVRASVLENNTARSVLKLSIDGDASGRPMVHFEHWEKWVYIWKNEKPYLGIYTGLVYGVNRTSYDLSRGDVNVGFTRYVLVHRIPEEAKVPVASVSDDEMGAWGCGTAYEWAKPLFPAEYRDKIAFVKERPGPKPEDTDKAKRLAKELDRAAEAGSAADVEKLLDQGADVNALNYDGLSALHWAAHKNLANVAKLLLDRGANPNNARKGGPTPLHTAATCGCRDIAELLVAKGANVNVSTKDSITPLALAAELGHTGTVELLLSKGADPNVADTVGYNALHKAAQSGHTAVVKALAAKGANLAAKTGNGDTALHLAARNGNREMIETLLSRGADIKAAEGLNSGRSALHDAALAGKKDIVELLIARGADLKAVTAEGWTPLHGAAGNGHKETVELLIARGADVSATDKDGRTPLHWAPATDARQAAELLVAKGAAVEAQDKSGRTPLHSAALHDAPNTARFLIEKGARPDAKDNHNIAPLHLAASEGNKAVTGLLLDKGADANCKDGEGKTPLHLAVEKNAEAIAELLLAKGTNANAADDDGRTALHRAAAKGQKSLVKSLLASGANVNAKDNDGKTPLQEATAGDFAEIIVLLNKAGAKE